MGAELTRRIKVSKRILRGGYARKRGGLSRAPGRPTGGYTQSWRGTSERRKFRGVGLLQSDHSPFVRLCDGGIEIFENGGSID